MASVSVIIPIYNSEKYLEKCLSSVKNQTFFNFEVVMVDDGSTDGSAEICKKYVNDDKRFRYIYKENGGEGSARNRGLDEASADYIVFIDSDDYVDSDYLESLFEPLKEQDWDMIQCGMNIRRGKDVNCVSLTEREFHGSKFHETVLKRDFNIFLFITTTSKIYKREMIVNSGVRFDEDVVQSVDCLFNTQILPFIKDVKHIKYVGYNYIQNISSVTRRKPTYNSVFQAIKVGNITSGIRNSLIGKYAFENNPDVIKGFHTAICIIYISNAHEIELGGFSNEEKQSLYKSYFDVMNYSVDKAIGDYAGTDKQIILASVNKNYSKIEKIYKLRELKKKIFR